MVVLDGLEAIRTPIAESTVAIGTFDGIHLGHQAIIAAAVEDARSRNRPALVFTFDRHPAELLAPEHAPPYLTTLEQRAHLISDLGTDALVTAHFDEALASMPAGEFVTKVICYLLGARAVVVGSNFQFGYRRSGDVSLLESMQASSGYRLRALDPVLVDGTPVSSTRIRDAVLGGAIEEAERLLGHAYLVAGVVVPGQQLGRKLGYPTANVELTCRQVMPPDGIYAVNVLLASGETVMGAASIGNRPTVAGAGRAIEVHLLDFSRDIYGQTLEIRFAAWLRAEARFDNLESLTAQIERDVAQARSTLERE